MQHCMPDALGAVIVVLRISVLVFHQYQYCRYQILSLFSIFSHAPVFMVTLQG